MRAPPSADGSPGRAWLARLSRRSGSACRHPPLRGTPTLVRPRRGEARGAQRGAAYPDLCPEGLCSTRLGGPSGASSGSVQARMVRVCEQRPAPLAASRLERKGWPPPLRESLCGISVSTEKYSEYSDSDHLCKVAQPVVYTARRRIYGVIYPLAPWEDSFVGC
jgi:hypothetical protein